MKWLRNYTYFSDTEAELDISRTFVRLWCLEQIMSQKRGGDLIFRPFRSITRSHSSSARSSRSLVIVRHSVGSDDCLALQDVLQHR
jgi:hypothetical protein